ncbi:MAG: pilus assembly protein PilM [bacterium]|nr:pilus assembly protein PilM [bacterium]
MINIGLSKKVIGLDISDHSMELVRVEKKGGKFVIESKARTTIEPNIIKFGDIVDTEKLRTAVIDLIAKTNIKIETHDTVIIGLPTSQTYATTFKIKTEINHNLINAIRIKLSTEIPLEPAKTSFTYKILEKNDGVNQVLVVSANSDIIQKYIDFFSKLGIKNVHITSEFYGQANGLGLNKKKNARCVLDIGSNTTNINLFDNNGMRFSYQSNTAGNKCIGNIAKSINKPTDTARELFHKDGLVSDDKEYLSAVTQCFDDIVLELKRVFKYVLEHFGLAVEDIILIGGLSQTNGILKYFETKLTDKKIEIGTSPYTDQKDFLFIEAIGLAIVGFDKKSWEQSIFDIEKKIIRNLEQ